MGQGKSRKNNQAIGLGGTGVADRGLSIDCSGCVLAAQTPFTGGTGSVQARGDTIVVVSPDGIDLATAVPGQADIARLIGCMRQGAKYRGTVAVDVDGLATIEVVHDS